MLFRNLNEEELKAPVGQTRAYTGKLDSQFLEVKPRIVTFSLAWLNRECESLRGGWKKGARPSLFFYLGQCVLRGGQSKPREVSTVESIQHRTGKLLFQVTEFIALFFLFAL